MPLYNDRKPKIADYETQEGQAYITNLYRFYGYTDKQAADDIGISRSTLNNWRNKSKTIKNAILLGKSHMDVLVENRLLQKALNGDVTAMIFWLKNRRPEMWRDRKEFDVDANVAVQFVEDVPQNDG